ncbi:unnamed protein product [Urochloa humidicola]
MGTDPTPPEGTTSASDLKKAAPHTESSTTNKRKRKNTTYKKIDGDSSLDVTVNTVVQAMYTKYVRHEFIKADDENQTPNFVAIGGFHCSYGHFRSSLKPRGFVADDVMSLFVEKFNSDQKNIPDSSNTVKRIAFCPFLSSLMVKDGGSFIAERKISEIRRINTELDIGRADLLFFPICQDLHWFVICINQLKKELHLFTSTNIPSYEQSEKLINTLYRLWNICDAISTAF